MEARSTPKRPISLGGLAKAAGCRSQSALSGTQIYTLGPDKIDAIASTLGVHVDWLREGKLTDWEGNALLESNAWQFAIPQHEPDWSETESLPERQRALHEQWLRRTKATLTDLSKRGTVPDFLMPYIRARCAHFWISRYMRRFRPYLRPSVPSDIWMRTACSALRYWKKDEGEGEDRAYGTMFAWLPSLSLIHRVEYEYGLEDVSADYQHAVALTHREIRWLFDACCNYWISGMEQFSKVYRLDTQNDGADHIRIEYAESRDALAHIRALRDKLWDILNLKNMPKAGGKRSFIMGKRLAKKKKKRG